MGGWGGGSGLVGGTGGTGGTGCVGGAGGSGIVWASAVSGWPKTNIKLAMRLNKAVNRCFFINSSFLF